MSSAVTIIDYGIGNLFSVCRAFEHSGGDVSVSSDPAAILSAPRLVLPGVGAFADGMRGLRERGLDDALRAYAASGKPLLGICLGMQMFATRSEEFGEHQGLDIIPGRVTAIPATGSDGRPHKIPHIGWAALEFPTAVTGWSDSVLAGVRPGESVYLVHSYTLVPDDPEHRLADCRYDGRLISAAVRCRNVTGCQFHPEKSGEVGLRIIKGFLSTN